MKSKVLHDEKGLKTFALVFDKNDDVRERLLEFADANRLADAHLMADCGATRGFRVLPEISDFVGDALSQREALFPNLFPESGMQMRNPA